MAQDWLEDLVEFGPDSVAKACQRWRREQTRRPLPADIRKMCIEAETRQQERSEHADANSYAKSLGYPSEAARIAAIRADEKDRAGRYERARLVREELIHDGGIRRGNAHAAAERALRETVDEAEALRRGRVALGLEQDPPPAAAEAAE